MMQFVLGPLFLLALSASAPQTRPASTATRPNRPSRWSNQRYVEAAGTFQMTTNSFSSVAQPLANAERETVTAAYRVSSAPGFQIGGGVRVSRTLAIGAAFERSTKSSGADVSAQVPHPFFFNQLRTVAGRSSNLDHDENAVHLGIAWFIPMTRRVELGIHGGPSWINVTQAVVADVNVSQSYPFDTAAFASAITARQTQSAFGAHAGASVDYVVRPRVAIALTARYSRARVHFNSADTGTIGVDAGGGHVGAGLRFRF